VVLQELIKYILQFIKNAILCIIILPSF